MRRLAWSIFGVVVVLALSWLSGYDFNTRGFGAVYTFGGAVFVFCWVYFAPWWRK